MSRCLEAALVACAFALACDGGSSGPDRVLTTTTSIPAPVAAKITLEVLDLALVSSQGDGALFGLELKMVESAGLGANIDFFRLDVLRATGELEERSEIGADELIAALGSNRIEAKATWQRVLVFFFRATIKKGRTLAVTARLTDDHGHAGELTKRFVVP